ncbi:MAG: hypothetical protein D6753_01770 [Planctomycetota bacterium]|nr:MAG: hypothetical protein D6753_01770 [Planctomycetota bacterium]
MQPDDRPCELKTSIAAFLTAFYIAWFHPAELHPAIGSDTSATQHAVAACPLGSLPRAGDLTMRE